VEIAMRVRRWLIGILVLGVFGGVAYMAGLAQPTVVAMADAANKFLATLTAEQRTKCTFKFEDAERFNWHFVPLEDKATRTPTRKGVALGDMNDRQREAALDMLKTAVGEEGFKTATTVMSLETILHELEKGTGPTRNAGWYFITIFGTPANTGKWGWRVEGHHLSLNFTIDDGKIVSATPFFLGANPAVVKQGDRKGLRTLPEIEDHARALFNSLDDQQKKLARQDKAMPEIAARNKAPSPGKPVGLPVSKMNAKQEETLRKLLDAYFKQMPADVARAERQKIVDAGHQHIHFAYWGGTAPGEPYTYRVQGPTFVTEFLNVQADSAKNPANHIHSVQRSMDNDFGLGRGK